MHKGDCQGKLSIYKERCPGSFVQLNYAPTGNLILQGGLNELQRVLYVVLVVVVRILEILLNLLNEKLQMFSISHVFFPANITCLMIL